MCSSLHSACTSIAQGSIPREIAVLLSASRLISLPKSNGDVRPIAVGEVLRRLTARAMCLEVKSELATFFAPIQHGVATEGGSELMIHQVQLLLESHPEWSVLKSDVSNAFNSLHRSHMFKEVAASFPSIYQHVCQMYGHCGYLVCVQGNDTVILKSEEGVHQGDPLGPALFSLALQHPLLSLQEQHPDVVFLAYLDEVFLLGPAESILSAFDDMKRSFVSIGLHAGLRQEM